MESAGWADVAGLESVAPCLQSTELVFNHHSASFNYKRFQQIGGTCFRSTRQNPSNECLFGTKRASHPDSGRLQSRCKTSETLAKLSYSNLNATRGSIRAARHAGTQHATRAATSNTAAVTNSVHGSVVLTPTSRRFSVLFSMSA